MFKRFLLLFLNWLVLFGCIVVTGESFSNRGHGVSVLVLSWSLLVVVIALRVKWKDLTVFQVIASLVWTAFLLPGYFPRREPLWYWKEYTFLVLFAVMLVLFGVDFLRTFRRGNG